MKNLYFLFSSIAVLTFLVLSCDGSNDISESIQSKRGKAKEKCTSIQSGKIKTTDGRTIKVGFDKYGYNYQAQIYSGEPYPNSEEWADWFLLSKWNDAWLSTKDCDDDGLLDSRYGYESYRGSGAWVTNHWKHSYISEDGKKCNVTIFSKYIAVPEGAYLENGFYYTADGIEIGEYTFDDFALIQKIVNDPCNGMNGLQYKSPNNPGLGNLR
jgi:hypothetical protein